MSGSELLQLEWLRLYLRDHRRHLSVGINLRSVLGFLHNTCRDVLNHGDGRRHIPAERTRQNGTIFPYGFLPSTIQPLKGGQQHLQWSRHAGLLRGLTWGKSTSVHPMAMPTSLTTNAHFMGIVQCRGNRTREFTTLKRSLAPEDGPHTKRPTISSASPS